VIALARALLLERRRMRHPVFINGGASTMPYLQLDTPFKHSAEDKQKLAKRFGEIYSIEMSANINRLTVAIRELGESGCWRCGDGAPYPAAILMCDIREGRSAEKREDLAWKLVRACQDILGFTDMNINLEFTQHRGDEMFHTRSGGLSDDWRPGEADKFDAATPGGN
jgi:phenylpyruvate tautomerase PptA (4-oxalocrotonate tautomerase family)